MYKIRYRQTYQRNNNERDTKKCHQLINYIRYKYDGGVEIYEGQLQVEKLGLPDIINAINHRLNNIPERKTTLAYHKCCEETCFLVELAYDFDKLEQYFEDVNNNLVLNFCNKNLVSYYSISFYSKEKFSKEAILQRSTLIKFSNQIKASLITFEQAREEYIPFNLHNLKIGRTHYRNNLYYKNNDITFCLPVAQLIDIKEKDGVIEKFVKEIDIKIDDDAQRINIHINTLRHAYGKRNLENNYYGYLDLNKFDFIIEKHEEELLSS